MRFVSLLTIFFSIVFVTLLGCAGTRTQEATGEYVDDVAITTKVKAAIFADRQLKSAEINVETFKGVVQLSGFVSSKADIQRAIDVVSKVQGVRSIKNSMLIK